MWIRLIIVIILISGSLGGLFYWKMEQNKQQAQALSQRKLPPFVISAEKAKAEDWVQSLQAIGTLSAVQGGEIKSETAGRIAKLQFQSGADVKKGQVLVQVDDSEEQAELRSLQAQLRLARLEYQRSLKLVQQKNISEANLDQNRAQLEEAEAAIEKLKAVIEKKQIRAPFDGRLGLRQVDPGEYLTVGQTITTLQALDPLYVDFVLPEKYLPQLKLGQTVEVHLDAYSEQIFKGKLSALDAEIDPSTRNINLQATLANPELKLLPGMFAELDVILPDNTQVISVPETAITYSLYGDSVFIVKETGKDEQNHPLLQVERRYITTGRAQDGRVAISKGLEADETVVSAGQLKLRDGAQVMIK